MLNGKPATGIALADRGLHYGDGIFRTLRVRNGQPQAWSAHWQRLLHDCDRLFLPTPDAQVLLDECRQLFDDMNDGVLKIIVTRGASGRGYTPAQAAVASRLLLRYPPSAPWPEACADIGVCTLRLGRNPQLAGIKHLNRLEQVLARRECQQAGWSEALLLDTEGWIISGTMSNLFVVHDGRLMTPKLDYAGVIGATRERLIAAATQAGIACEQKNMGLQDCLNADEIFLCNSLMGACAVTHLRDKHFVHGEITRWCQQQLVAELQ